MLNSGLHGASPSGANLIVIVRARAATAAPIGPTDWRLFLPARLAPML